MEEDFEKDLTANLAVKKSVKKEPEGILTVDVLQTEDEVIVQSTIAGANQEDLDIELAKDMITIRGKRISDIKAKPSDYDYQELYWGPFSRTIILPVDIDVEGGAKASIKNGILTVRLPKLEKSRVKKLKIS